ncbi:DUF1858 domain-containing protein [Candidatus Micrarchaeota archaeon]|nr:DUF1858 domain-containing protein [Candidatus Micrarchaeota archaeon]
MSEKISKDSIIYDVVQKHPQAVKVFFEQGLHCVGCGMALMETVEAGCAAHGIDAELVVKRINEEIAKEKKAEKKKK